MYVDVIGEPARIQWYGKTLHYWGKYLSSSVANQKAKQFINSDLYVAVVAGSLKDKQSKRPQFYIIYTRLKLDHEKKRRK